MASGDPRPSKPACTRFDLGSAKRRESPCPDDDRLLLKFLTQRLGSISSHRPLHSQSPALHHRQVVTAGNPAADDGVSVLRITLDPIIFNLSPLSDGPSGCWRSPGLLDSPPDYVKSPTGEISYGHRLILGGGKLVGRFVRVDNGIALYSVLVSRTHPLITAYPLRSGDAKLPVLRKHVEIAGLPEAQ